MKNLSLHSFIYKIYSFVYSEKKRVRERDISSFHIYDSNLTSALKMSFEQLNAALNLDSQHNYGKIPMMSVASVVKKLLAEMYANKRRTRL
jgi:hypothetical protein